jgi:hypothetical protein
VLVVCDDWLGLGLGGVVARSTRPLLEQICPPDGRKSGLTKGLPFDTSTPAGRMLVQMLGVFAEFEREIIIGRVRSGMKRKAAKGNGPADRSPTSPRARLSAWHARPA